MIKAGVPCVPGSEGALPDDPKEIVRIARGDRLPGDHQGGRRRRRARHARRAHRGGAAVARCTLTRAEAQAAFGNPAVYMEKFLEQPAPHRDPGAGRRAQERGLAGRARLLDAAPPPEDHRGGAGAGHRRARARRASASAAPTPAARSATAAPARSSSSTRTTSSTSSR